MDLNHYFEPVDFSVYSENSKLKWTKTLGAVIEKNTQSVNNKNWETVEVAIIGLPFETQENGCVQSMVANRVREELYHLAGFGKIKVVDLGNLKPAQSQKGNFLALRDVVDYLSELDITTIVIGGSEDFSFGICQTFRNNRFFTFSTIDACLDTKNRVENYQPENYLSRIFSVQSDIFQFSLIGYQRHYVPDESLSKLKGIGLHLSLGTLRENLTLAESVFRNSDFVSVDFGTLKYSEAFGKKHLPNGLGGEEVCQLSQYAGMSKRIKAFALFEITDSAEAHGINTALAAQAAWYFLEGVSFRSHLDPEKQEGFKIHKVEVWQVETPLVFFQNEETGQWWMQMHAPDNSFIYLACSEQDFFDASHNEIPEIWLKYVQKIDEILK